MRLFEGSDDEETPEMADGTGLAEALLGLDGFRVLEVTETDAEVIIEIETTADVVGCGRCGTRAESQDRMAVEIRDLACFGRPTRLLWRKRRWRCPDGDCDARSWTETSPHALSRSVLTRRAGVEACRQVGMNARPVAGLARELGVCWWTIQDALEEHGRPLVDDPNRVGVVRNLGVDETSLLAATATHPTIYATGLVDLDARIIIDMVQGNAAADLRRWCAAQDKRWLGDIATVATDLAESYRAGLNTHLGHAQRVADPFHVVRAANRCVDKVRRRVQNECHEEEASLGDSVWVSPNHRHPREARRSCCTLDSICRGEGWTCTFSTSAARRSRSCRRRRTPMDCARWCAQCEPFRATKACSRCWSR